MKRNTLLICVLIAQAIVCFLIWRSLPSTHLSNGVLSGWIVASLASACALGFASQVSAPKIILGVVAAAVVGVILAVVTRRASTRAQDSPRLAEV